MFSPISQRSWSVRLLYILLYVILLLGGATMIVPFLIMITGSLQPLSQPGNGLLPSYYTNDSELWQRYVGAKYQDSPVFLRMAWNDPNLDLQELTLPEKAPEDIRLWEEFVREEPMGTKYSLLGFLRATSRMPSYSGRLFRIWLMDQFGTLENLNRALDTHFITETAVFPPRLGILGSSRPHTPLMAKYDEFCSKQVPEYLIPWNVGNYYRLAYLPNAVGPIETFNAKYGSQFSSYSEVPFGSLAPEIGQDLWLQFVGKLLSPDFVELTESGLVAQKASGIGKDEFCRTMARPEHLRVVSADTRFSDWAAAKHGIKNAQIPQKTIDLLAFNSQRSFWKWEFTIMNYQRVLDEILLHGRALVNTLILVVLSVAGALLVNPLAAYALSRFKMRKTYHILLFCLATIAFPAEVTMIPVFLQLKELNLLNTFGALVLPGLASGFSIFLLKGFFDSLPKELYEAAELDGASEWTMFWLIGMNLSKPILAVIALGAFTSAYGTFFYALILAPDPKMWTIMVYIFQLSSAVDPPVVYASLLLTAIPTLLVFIFCQNMILRGIVVPSDK